MADSYRARPVTRRMFLDTSLKGAAALALSGLAVFAPRKGFGGEFTQPFLDMPSPQFPAWTPDGKLLVTFVARDGSYGFLQRPGGAKDFESFRSVGSAPGQFNWPQGIAVHNSIAYIADSNNGRMQRFDLGGQRFLDPFGGLGRKSGRFLRPMGICVFADELFIADTRNHRIQVFSLQGEVKRNFGELGDANDQFRLPTSCAVSRQGEVFVVDSKHALVKVFDTEGRFLRKFGGLSSSRREPGLLSAPVGISADGKEDIVYVADTGNGRIQAFDKNGRWLRFVEARGVELKSPRGTALSATGELAVSDPDAGKVWLMTV